MDINETFESTLVKNGHSIAINVPAYIIKKNNLKPGMALNVNVKATLVGLDKEILKGVIESFKSIKGKKDFDFNQYALYLMARGSASEQGLSLEEYLSKKGCPKEYTNLFLSIEKSIRV